MYYPTKVRADLDRLLDSGEPREFYYDVYCAVWDANLSEDEKYRIIAYWNRLMHIALMIVKFRGFDYPHSA